MLSSLVLPIEMVINLPRYLYCFLGTVWEREASNIAAFSSILGASGTPMGSQMAPFLVLFAGVGVA